ncbi:hypothetical protein MPER_07719 [Moniliophthora perniciosa FA553]|nr:hypothetical protein MPER_07719 [Moniliophthora perniciosa FA553]
MVPQMAYPTPSPTVSAFSASPTSPAWMPHAPIPEPEPTYVNFAADTQMYNGSAWTQDGYQGQPISCPHPVPTNAGNPPSAEWPMSSSWQEEQLVPGNQYDHDIAAVAMQSAYLCPTPASYPVPLPPSPVSPLAFLTPISSSPPSTAYAAVPPSVEYDVNFAWEQQTAPGNGYGTTTGYQSLDIPEISMDSDLGPSTLFKPVLPHGTFPMVDEPDSSLQYLLDELAPQQDTEMDSWISTISSGAQGTWDHDWV